MAETEDEPVVKGTREQPALPNNRSEILNACLIDD
jgi:hypothetical protein